jgi:hypothetical protein
MICEGEIFGLISGKNGQCVDGSLHVWSSSRCSNALSCFFPGTEKMASFREMNNAVLAPFRRGR